jgi:putative transposase
MPRKRRALQPYSYYHIYNRGNNRYKVFRQPEDKQVFLNMLFEYQKSYKIKIIAYCIMNNHFHLIIKTGVCPRELSLLMQAFMTKFCIYINRKYDRVGHVFQGRYNAKLVKSSLGLERLKKYLKQNPVKEGLVKDPEDYKWTRVWP